MKLQSTATVLRRYVQSLAACCYLFTGGILRRRNRPLLYKICEHFGFEHDDSPVPQIPRALVSEIIGPVVDVRVTELAGSKGNVSMLELLVIAAVVRQMGPRLSLEIGTFDGRTTMNIALNQPQGGEILTLDLPAAARSGTNLSLDSGDAEFIDKAASGQRIDRTRTEVRITQTVW